MLFSWQCIYKPVGLLCFVECTIESLVYSIRTTFGKDPSRTCHIRKMYLGRMHGLLCRQGLGTNPSKHFFFFFNGFFCNSPESRAIIRYIAAKYADRGPNLLGSTMEERALVDQWLEVESHNYNDSVFTLIFQLVILPRMGKPGDLALARNCEKELEKVLDIYEERLSKSKYLAGDSFTLADLSHLPGTRYLMNEAGMSHLVRERKNVNAWWEDISNRPAWKKVMMLMD